MVYREELVPDGGPLTEIHQWLSKHVPAICHNLRPFIVQRFGWRKSGRENLSGTARELEAIGNYARFAARHPEMPFYHRERIPLQILKCCEDAKAGLH